MKTLPKTPFLILSILFCAAAMAFITNKAEAAGASRVADAIWAHGELYATVGTPTAFKQAPEGTTDVIYSFRMSGLTGQRSIADSTPENPDYNGGRWHVMAVVFTEEGLAIHDPDGDGQVNFELKSEADLVAHYLLGHIEVFDTDIRFECPMIPQN